MIACSHRSYSHAVAVRQLGLQLTDHAACRELQKQVISGAIPVDCAFINAIVVRSIREAEAPETAHDASGLGSSIMKAKHLLQVPDIFLLQLAATAALTAHARSKLTTRSLHAELLYNLSGSRQVS